MRDAERRLLRCIGGIDDELILEAATARFRPKRWGHLIALAACLALVLTIPAFLNQGKPGPEAAPGYEQAESPESSNNKFAGTNGVGSAPAAPYLAMSNTITVYHHTENGWQSVTVTDQTARTISRAMTDDEPQGATIKDRTPSVWLDFGNGTIAGVYRHDNTASVFTCRGEFDPADLPELVLEESGAYPGLDDAVNLALSGVEPFSLGGLRPGMHKDEVRALYGDPVLEKDEGLTWFYGSFYVEFHRFDETVKTVYTGGGCPLILNSGIGLGSTAEDVTAAYPDVRDWFTGSETDWDTMYEIYDNDVTLRICAKAGTVVSMELMQYLDPMYDALTVNEITIYQWIDKQWQTTTVIDKAAKYICTVLTISEPEEATGEKDGVSMWMDFGNGTAVELLGGDRASVWTYAGDTFDPEKTDGLTYQIGGVFKDLDKYVAEALADPTATWEQDAWDNIIHEGAPESAPEAEP